MSFINEIFGLSRDEKDREKQNRIKNAKKAYRYGSELAAKGKLKKMDKKKLEGLSIIDKIDLYLNETTRPYSVLFKEIIKKVKSKEVPKEELITLAEKMGFDVNDNLFKSAKIAGLKII